MEWQIRGGKPENIPVGDDPVKALETKLKSIPKPKQGQLIPVITIQVDKRMKYSILVYMMDACKRNGFNDISVMPLSRTEPKKKELEKKPSGVELPEAKKNKPVNPKEDPKHIIFLNVGPNGLLPLGEPDPIEGKEKIQKYMNSLCDALKKSRGEAGVKSTTVVISGSKDTDFEYVYNVMLAAKKAGFPNVQLWAYLPRKD